MPVSLPFRRLVLEGMLTRVAPTGEVLVALPGATARLTPATPTSAVQALPSAVEGLELASFELGDPPGLELEASIGCVNDLLLLLLARRGYRSVDNDPMTPAMFAGLRTKQLDRTDNPAQLTFRAPDPEDATRRMVLHFDGVEMVVRGLLAQDGVIHRVKLGTVIHQDFSREFVPLLGYAGHVTFEPRKGAST